MFIISIYTVGTLVLSCLANPVSDVEHLREYVKDIQSQIDNTVKPCEDFGKYACGNFKHEESHSMSLEIAKLIKQDILHNEEPKTNDEKLVRSLYLSCKYALDHKNVLEQVDALKSVVPSFPVTRDYNAEEIARLFGYLATIEVAGFLSIDVDYLNIKNVLNINLRSKATSKNLMSNTLEKFGVNPEETVKIVEDLLDLTNQLGNIDAENIKGTPDTFNNVAAFKEVVPNFDWDSYLTTFAKELDVQHILNKPVEIYNLEKLKKQVEIIRATDSKTIVNYIVWRLLTFVSFIDCEKLAAFLKPILVIQNLHEENDFKKFFLQEFQTLKHFEESLSELRSQLNNPESDDLSEYVKVNKNSYGNYEDFLSGKYITKLLNNVEINDKTWYSNLINILHVIFQDMLANGGYGNVTAFGEFLLIPVSKYIKMGNHLQSTLHSFVTTNKDFWVEVIDMDNISENRTIDENCLLYENNENYTYRNQNYLNLHAAYHIALQDYLHFIDEHEDEFKKQTQVLTEAGLNHSKAYMLALAHEKCVKFEAQTLDDDDRLLSFFKHSKQFSDTWGCVAGDAMHKVCDDSTFVANFKKKPS